MNIKWSLHAQDRFLKRVEKLDLTKDEIEIGVEKQEVALHKGYDEWYKEQKIETIFQVRGSFITVQKVERRRDVKIITMWESSPEEVNVWKKRKDALGAADM